MTVSAMADPLSEQPRRRSVFREVGLGDEDDTTSRDSTPKRPQLKLRFRSKPDVFEYSSSEYSDSDEKSEELKEDSDIKSDALQEMVQTHSAAHARFQGSSSMYRFSAAALILAISLPLLHGTPWFGQASVPSIGVTGGVIRRDPNPVLDIHTDMLVRRDNSPTDICTRWSHQTALVNGTLYIYGGEATTSPGQTENTWNNDFLSMDLTTSWQISSPPLSGLSQPSGPPNISNGALWNSYTSLYLYGGEFSWKPVDEPTAFSMWEYNLVTSQWYEHSNPTTSAGQNAEPDGEAVQRSAEGAGLAVPALGRGWYFGGHQDGYTTEGWSQSVYRIYLQSLLEFTFPGSQNDQVTALSNNQTAGTDGNWRNITQGGVQTTAGFPERADGLLLYVPGFGANGLLLGLAGGTNETLQQMNEVDVFDIATSVWYKQATSGSTPEIRVNPCGVVAAAADGSSYNVYMFGGQSLTPYDNQTQYNDMWILTIPSFTWIQVDQSSQSVPYARAGHTCNIWDSQMIVVGGYVGADLSCDSPGIYAFDLSKLEWVEKFTALSGDSAASSSSGSSSASATSSASGTSSTFVSNSKTNPLNQQPNQMANGSSPGGLEGSYGYSVPNAVISVIGGGATGGATITAPAQTASAGPLKTGKPVTYTVTQSNGATVTETSSANGTFPSSGSTNSGSSGPNIAAIVAGTIAGLLLILVCYLAFCAWLYKKQLQLYKRHVEMSQRQENMREDEKTAFVPPGPLFGSHSGDASSKSSSDRRRFVEGAKLSSEISHTGSGGQGSAGGGAYESLRRGSSGADSGHDLMGTNEPTFWGTMLAPRKSLRVVNRD